MTKSSLRNLFIFGVPSCLGAQDTRCESGPFAIRSAGLEQALSERFEPYWHNVAVSDSTLNEDKVDAILSICEQLARGVEQIGEQQFVVLGGDHSCAIGTWSGVKRNDATKNRGLIWIDAHMDSHLPETSPSHALHGMPLACLLGHGDKRFCELSGTRPVLLPQNVVLLGIRSYEPEEAVLLELLGVKVFTMQDISQQGFINVFSEALTLVKSNSDSFGVSIDLDAIDPRFAPGVGSPEQNGIYPDELCLALSSLRNESAFRGLEIVELNPARDIDNKTVDLCIRLVTSIY
ncbi:MAG: arginase [Gammaproteobacteria bacterium]|nr:arginase [Gammaproteobacteria bacterium]